MNKIEPPHLPNFWYFGKIKSRLNFSPFWVFKPASRYCFTKNKTQERIWKVCTENCQWCHGQKELLERTQGVFKSCKDLAQCVYLCDIIDSSQCTLVKFSPVFYIWWNNIFLTFPACFSIPIFEFEFQFF